MYYFEGFIISVTIINIITSKQSWIRFKLKNIITNNNIPHNNSDIIFLLFFILILISFIY